MKFIYCDKINRMGKVFFLMYQRKLRCIYIVVNKSWILHTLIIRVMYYILSLFTNIRLV